MPVRAHVHIRGKVQGVTYRASTRRRARELDVKGWVRNLPDGRVEAVFEGDKEKVRKIIEWCKKGPSRAEVSGMDLDWEKPTGEYGDFSVRY